MRASPPQIRADVHLDPKWHSDPGASGTGGTVHVPTSHTPGGELVDQATRGLTNVLTGDFGEYWVHAVAAGAEFFHGPAATVDMVKADVQLTLPRESIGGQWQPVVWVQVKTTGERLDVKDGHASFSLDVQTYRELSRGDSRIRRVLAVIWLSDPAEKVRVDEQGTTLVGRGLWTSLEEAPPTRNTESVVVKLSVKNTLDAEGLRRMLETYGVGRTTEVPDVDIWAEDEL